MYEPGKVIYIGGGNDAGTDLPSAATEVIDLTEATPDVAAGRDHAVPQAPAQRDRCCPTAPCW